GLAGSPSYAAQSACVSAMKPEGRKQVSTETRTTVVASSPNAAAVARSGSRILSPRRSCICPWRVSPGAGVKSASAKPASKVASHAGSGQGGRVRLPSAFIEADVGIAGERLDVEPIQVLEDLARAGGDEARRLFGVR